MTCRSLIGALLVLATALPPLIALPALAESASAGKDDTSKPISYWNDVRPVFQAHCQGCHQPAKSSGEYNMTTFDGLLAGGESGESSVVPSDPDASYLIEQITPMDGQAAMPPEARPLSQLHLALIRRWVEEGAVDDTPPTARRHYNARHPPEYSAAPVVSSLQFSPDGNWLAVSGYHEVLLHKVEDALLEEIATPIRLVGMSERIESISFSPDGLRLAVAGGSPGRLGELQVWNLDPPELVVSTAVSFDTCYGASWSHDGRFVAIGCPDNTVRAIDSETGMQVLFNAAHNDWVLDTVFSVDSAHLVTVSRDRSMKLMEVATERFIDNITSITPGALKGGLHAVDRHPSKNQLVIGGADGIPKIYRMFREKARKIGDDYNKIRAYPSMPGRIFDVAFSHDGALIAAGSSYNRTGHVHIFASDSDKKTVELKDIDAAIYAVAFSPDGKLIASGGFNGTILIHDVASGHIKARFVPVPLTPQHVANAPD